MNDIEQYRFKIRVYLTSLGFLAAFGFSIFLFFRGEFGNGSMAMFCAIYFSVVVYLLLKRKHYLWEGRGYAVVLSVTLLSVTKSNPEYGIFWAYVWVSYIFLLMKFKEAMIAAAIFVPFTLYFIHSYYPANILARIYATLFLVGLFAIVFSFLIEKLLTKVNRLITHDPLTKALNRSTFHSSLEDALSSFTRYETPSALVIFDLDHFKEINDKYGHQTGDKVLKGVSKLVRARLRDTDKFFRYGGEEFAILLPNSTQNDAMLLAENVRQMIERHDFNTDKPVTISGGVSQTIKQDAVNSWIERCDKALYQAKSQNRNKMLCSSYSSDS